MTASLVTPHTEDGFDYAQMDDNGRGVRGALGLHVDPPDFVAMYAAGYRVVAIRRSYCYWDPNHQAWRLAHDPNYARDSAAARAAGLVVVAYYFGVYAAGAPSPAEQFANFLSGGGEVIVGVDLPPCVDFEWQSFRNLLQAPTAVVKLLVAHVSLIRARFGRAMVYTSQNEVYDLGEPAIPELADTVLWCKTAYPVPAGRERFNGSIMLPHVAAHAADPHEYFRVPRPWAAVGARIQQTQGDARRLGADGMNQADLNRLRVSVLGEQGPEVVEVQQRLNDRGAKLEVDGDFGALTEAAVKAEQAAGGLPVTGEVDARTYARIVWPAAA